MAQNVPHQESLPHRPIGTYLVEAGLLTDAQVGVALADQNVTALPFGEIVVARGWVKEQTVEFIMERVIKPERSFQPAVGMEDCMTRRQRPMSGRPSTQSSTDNPLKETVAWIG